MACFQIRESGPDIGQFIGFVDDWSYLSIPHEVTEDSHVRLIEFGDIGDELLAYEPGPQVSIELTKQTAPHIVVPAGASNPTHDTDAIRIQNAPSFGERMVPDQVKDQVI